MTLALSAGLLGGCTSSSSSTHRTTVACFQHRGTEVVVEQDQSSAPLSVVANQVLWLRFPGGGAHGSTLPLSTDPSVVKVEAVVNCPDSTFETEIHAVTPGRTVVTELVITRELSGSVQIPILVSARPAGPAAPPANSAAIHGGGLLVYPQRLYFDGANVQFVVPQVDCASGRSSRIDIGMSGLRTSTPPHRSSTITAWSAGLSALCSGSGDEEYRVGWNGGTQIGIANPGDTITVGTSGGDCPSLSLNLASVGSPDGPSRGGGGFGCAAGIHDEIRVITQPTILFGALVQGVAPAPLTVTFEDLSINGGPYRFAPHELRTQTLQNSSAVSAQATANWYQLRLNIP